MKARARLGALESTGGLGMQLPSVELACVRARATRALFGDDATVRLGRYELLQRIGAGGMGLVYRARDPKLGRTVALKITRPGRSEHNARAHLAAEASMLALLDDPDVVQVYDLQADGETVFMAMELAPGTTLDTWLCARPRSVPEIVDVFVRAGRILSRVHAAGVVHADFKPQNVLVHGDDGGPRVRLLDFGVAVRRGTQVSGPVGTPGFMASEIRTGGTLTEHVDQFSFCVSLNRALTDRAISRRLRRAVDRGFREDARERWADMDALLGALEPEAAPRRGIERSLAFATLLCVGVCAAVLFAVFSRDEARVQTAASRCERPASWADAAHACEASAAVAALLTEGRERLSSGRSVEARELATQARRASYPDVPWLMPQADLLLGRVERTEGRYDRARELLEGAVFGALRVSDDRTVVLASCRLVELHLSLGSEAPSLTWLRQAEAALARLRAAPDLQLRVDAAFGLLELFRGKPAQAEERLTRALHAARDWYGPGSPELLSFRYDLGKALLGQRRHESARAHFDAVRRGWTREFGAEDSRVGAVWLALGEVDRASGRYEEALDAYQEAKRILGTRPSPDAVQQATLHLGLGDTQYRLGRSSDARASFDEAGKALDALGERHFARGAVEVGLGNLARDDRDWRNALGHFRSASDAFVEAGGPWTKMVAVACGAEGDAAFELGHLDEAEALVRRSIELRTLMQGAADPSLGFPLTTLGKVLWRRGELDDARRTLERALRLRQEVSTLDGRLVAETSLALAKVSWDLEDRDAALLHARRARSGFEGPWKYADQDVAMVAKWMSEHGLD